MNILHKWKKKLYKKAFTFQQNHTVIERVKYFIGTQRNKYKKDNELYRNRIVLGKDFVRHHI